MQKQNSNPNVSRILKVVLVISIVLPLTASCGEKADHSSAATTMPQEKEIAKPKNSVTLSSETVQRMQIQSITVIERQASNELISTGEIKADDTRVFHINSIVPGRIIIDKVALADVIKTGQVLGFVENLDVAKAYADFVHQSHVNEVALIQANTRVDLARKNMTRLQALYKEGIAPQKDFITAQAEVINSEAVLRGLEEEKIHIVSEARSLLEVYGVSLPPDADLSKHLTVMQNKSPLVAPRAGVVVKKNITLGDIVKPDDVLYVVADLSKVWLDITVYDTDIAKVHEGEEIQFTSDGMPGRTFRGRITYIQPAAGDITKTFLARATLDNHSTVLKPGMFGQVRVLDVRSQSKPYIPDACLQSFGKENFVFVETAPLTFTKRTIELGERLTGGYLCDKGISAGERIVGSGSFSLKAEILKGQFSQE